MPVKENFLIPQPNYSVPDTNILSPQLNQDSIYSKSRLKEIIRRYTAPQTKRNFNCDVKYFLYWANIAYNSPKNFTKDMIIHFIIQNFEGLNPEIEKKMLESGVKQKPGPLQITTIEKRIRNFGIFLELNDHPNVSKTPQVRMLIRRLRQNFRGYRKKNPITKEILDSMVATCNTNHPRDVRDKAILLFGWGSGGRRAHEICDVKVENFWLQNNGDYICTLEKTKTGFNFKVPVCGRAAKAIKDWIEVLQRKAGPMFVRVEYSLNLSKTRLSKTGLFSMVKHRIKKAGYDPEYFSPTSLRSGFITEAGRQNMPILDVMQMTTHKTMREMMEYYRHGAIKNNVCSKLVG